MDFSQLMNHLDASRGKMFKDYKTDFQEVVQKTATWKLNMRAERVWPDHDKLFVVNVYLNGTLMGTERAPARKRSKRRHRTR
ncbi:MAG: putative dsRNA-binding protein [Eubacteriales bacterium]